MLGLLLYKVDFRLFPCWQVFIVQIVLVLVLSYVIVAFQSNGTVIIHTNHINVSDACSKCELMWSPNLAAPSFFFPDSRTEYTKHKVHVKLVD